MLANFQSFQGSQKIIKTQVLQNLLCMIESMKKYINTFHLVDHDISFDYSKFGSREVDDELAMITLDEDILSSGSHNDIQQHAYHWCYRRFFLLKVLHSLLTARVG